MTVAQLIERLKRCPPDKEACFEDPNCPDDSYVIENVYIDVAADGEEYAVVAR